MPRHTDADDRPTTNRRETNSGQSPGQQTMAEVSHTNPKTGKPFGDSQVFERGKIAVVDGGAADCERDEAGDHEDEPMRDVDHTPRKDAPDASEAYDRGVERVKADDNEDETKAVDGTDPDTEADV